MGLYVWDNGVAEEAVKFGFHDVDKDVDMVNAVGIRGVACGLGAPGPGWSGGSCDTRQCCEGEGGVGLGAGLEGGLR